MHALKHRSGRTVYDGGELTHREAPIGLQSAKNFKIYIVEAFICHSNAEYTF
jgi:hypothetical protein